jgi:hypothetical protein
MGFDLHEPEQIRRLRAALKAADIKPGELWLHYFSIGGNIGEYEVEAYLQGLLSLPVIERDLLAAAANELIQATPRIRAPYSDELTKAAESGQPGRDGQQRPGEGQHQAVQENPGMEEPGQTNDPGKSLPRE